MKNQKSIVLLRPLKSIVDNEKLKIQLFNYNVYFGKSGDGFNRWMTTQQLMNDNSSTT